MNASTPAGLLVALGSGAVVVLAWVGAAVTMAIVLAFAFMGIKKGLIYFGVTFHDRNYVMSDYDRADTDPAWLADYDRGLADGMDHDAAFDYADTMERDGSLADVPDVEGYDTYEPGPAGANPDPTEWEVGR